MELNKRLNYKSLLELCKEHKKEIKARKNLEGVLNNRRVRYVNQEGHFGYAQFGDFYFTSMGVMMLITTHYDQTRYHVPDEMCDTLYSTVPVIFAGFETGFKDDLNRDIYTGDIVRLTRNSTEYTLMVNQVEWCKYPSLRADNHEIEFKEGDSMHIEGNIFYDLLAEHLENYDLSYYVSHNSLFLYLTKEELLKEGLEKISKAPFFKDMPKKIEKHTRCYDEQLYGYKAKNNDTIVLFCSNTEGCIDPEDELTFPEAYIDYTPKGCESLPSFCIPVNLENPDFVDIKKNVDEFLIHAHYNIEQTFIVVDYEKRIGNKKISKALDELFRPAYEYNLHNVILPFRIFNEILW